MFDVPNKCSVATCFRVFFHDPFSTFRKVLGFELTRSVGRALRKLRRAHACVCTRPHYSPPAFHCERIAHGAGESHTKNDQTTLIYGHKEWSDDKNNLTLAYDCGWRKKNTWTKSCIITRTPRCINNGHIWSKPMECRHLSTIILREKSNSKTKPINTWADAFV